MCESERERDSGESGKNVSGVKDVEVVMSLKLVPCAINIYILFIYLFIYIEQKVEIWVAFITVTKFLNLVLLCGSAKIITPTSNQSKCICPCQAT